MVAGNHKVQVYADLADWEQQHGSPQGRDRFLILAADAALTVGLNDEAEKYRARLLENNPHHLLRPYNSLADAMKSSDVYSYIADLRGTYPLEEAEKLLAAMQGDSPARTDAAPSSSAPRQPALPELPPPSAVLGGGRTAEEGQPLEAGVDPVPSPSPFGGLRPMDDEPPARKVPRAHRETASAPVSPPPSAEEEDAEERPAGIGVFFSDTLFFLLLAAGVVLAGYTLARPFLSLPDAPFKTAHQ